VQVGVEDGLAGAGAGVEHQAVVVVALGGGDGGRGGDQLGGRLGVAGGERCGAGVVVARDHQHVGRSLRVDVAERDRALGGVHDVGLDVTCDDAAEQAALHDRAPSSRPPPSSSHRRVNRRRR
jgi:hypothetical protein